MTGRDLSPPAVASFDVRSLDVADAAAAIAIDGRTAALARRPAVEARSLDVQSGVDISQSWRRTRPAVKTFGMRFPEADVVLPVAPATETPTTKIAAGPPAACKGGLNRGTRRTRTRVAPPTSALSLKDRLYYLLMPPIESWLRGQELVLPFEPFRYQYEGVAWLFARQAGLLADEMGLGKTMQAIVTIRMLLRAGQVRRVLIVCPKPLIPNWQRELATWAEEIPVAVVEGRHERRELMWRSPRVPVLLANYEVMSRDFNDWLSQADPHGRRSGCETAGGEAAIGEAADLPSFDLVLLDEAQRIKNRDSATARAARAIPRRRSYLLTGTPIENSPAELAALFEFLDIVPGGAEPDLRGLQRLAGDYILRRTKELAQPDMPPRIDRDTVIDLAPAQRSAYEQAEKDGVVQLDALEQAITVQHVFELVLRLKQLANYCPVTGESAKLERLRADMEEIAASGGKAILFSQWTRTIDWIAERTQDFGCLVYHGGIPTAQREPILDRFQHDPDAHLLLMSYGTGAVGLNLQFAHYVFLFDRWWNPAVEDQAVNRAHRVGVKKQVIVSRFICRDTVEERIDRVLQEKRALFEAVLGEADDACDRRMLTAGEIFGLFDLKARDREGTTREIAPDVPELTDDFDENQAKMYRAA